MRRFAAAFVVAIAITFGAAEIDCNGASSPSSYVEAGAGVATGVCSLIDGIDDSGVVRTICATILEVAQIAEFILTLRMADGGPPTFRAECKTLPGTSMCATSSERSAGILFVAHVREMRLMLDGGVP